MVGVHGGRSHKVAAKHADMVVTNSSTRESAAEYRRALDRALVEQGRTPGSVPPIPGLIPYLGRTTKEAGDRLAELNSFVDWEPIAPFTLGQFGLTSATATSTTRSPPTNLYNWIQERRGFNLMFSAGSAAIREFIDEVVPRLTDRGIYRPTPADRPLRERF